MVCNNTDTLPRKMQKKRKKERKEKHNVMKLTAPTGAWFLHGLKQCLRGPSSRSASAIYTLISYFS